MNAAAQSSFLTALARLAILAMGVTLAAKLIPGITCDSLGTLVAVVLLLTFFNWILKPLLVLFTLPFIVATMGLGLIFINALVLLLVGHLVQGFHVAGFGTAILGSIVISATNFLISALMRRTERASRRGRPPRGDDVIDI